MRQWRHKSGTRLHGEARLCAVGCENALLWVVMDELVEMEYGSLSELAWVRLEVGLSHRTNTKMISL